MTNTVGELHHSDVAHGAEQKAEGSLPEMKRPFLLRAVAVVLSLGLTLALAETSLRLVGFSNPRTTERNDLVGTIRRPGVEVFSSHEGQAFARFNSAGFRDEEWMLAKPPNTFRIAVLGASYVEAAGVAFGDRFTEVLERELHRSDAIGRKDVQVMSFAVAGWSTAQQLMCLRHFVWQYSPDMVIQVFTTGDLRRNSKALSNDDGRLFFTYVNGTLTPDDSFRQSPAHRRSWLVDAAFAVIDRSKSAQLAYKFWQVRASARQRAVIAETADAIGAGEEVGPWVYAAPTHPLREEAWKITEDLLTLASNETSQHGAQYLVLTLSNGIQVHPDSALREEFTQRVGVSDLFYPERRIAAAGQREGFAGVNLAPMLLEYAQNSGGFPHGFEDGHRWGHWNVDGHREAGRHVAEQVRMLLAK